MQLTIASFLLFWLYRFFWEKYFLLFFQAGLSFLLMIVDLHVGADHLHVGDKLQPLLFPSLWDKACHVQSCIWPYFLL
jgi:hypothetical protein